MYKQMHMSHVIHPPLMILLFESQMSGLCFFPKGSKDNQANYFMVHYVVEDELRDGFRVEYLRDSDDFHPNSDRTCILNQTC